MGLLITIGRLGTVLASYILPFLYLVDKDIQHPLFFGAGLCLVCLLLSIILITIDKVSQSKNNQNTHVISSILNENNDDPINDRSIVISNDNSGSLIRKHHIKKYSLDITTSCL